MVFGWLAQCSVLHPRSEGRDDQLQQGKDRQVVGVSTFLTCVSRGVLWGAYEEEGPRTEIGLAASLVNFTATS